MAQPLAVLMSFNHKVIADVYFKYLIVMSYYTILGHGQQFCEISRSNRTERKYRQDMDFGYASNVTLTFEI